jgi:hypothetical protein
MQDMRHRFGALRLASQKFFVASLLRRYGSLAREFMDFAPVVVRVERAPRSWTSPWWLDSLQQNSDVDVQSVFNGTAHEKQRAVPPMSPREVHAQNL